MKMKRRYDAHRLRNVEYEIGTVVFMKTVPSATGESTKLHEKYRGPLVVTRKLPSDTYLVSDLNDGASGRRYASTAHVSQLKLWEPELSEADDEKFDAKDDLDTSSESKTDEIEFKTIVKATVHTKARSDSASATNESATSNHRCDKIASPNAGLQAKPGKTDDIEDTREVIDTVPEHCSSVPNKIVNPNGSTNEQSECRDLPVLSNRKSTRAKRKPQRFADYELYE